MVMQRLYRTLLVSSLISAFVTLPGYADEIYKRVDEKGIPSFSDTKTEDAEKILVEPVKIQSVPTAAPPNATLTSTQPSFSYTKLDIISPADQATLRDEHKILMQVTVEPSLRQGHQIEFLDNGQPLQAAGQSPSVELMNFARGTHTLTARILDKHGKILLTGKPITLYIHRTSN